MYQPEEITNEPPKITGSPATASGWWWFSSHKRIVAGRYFISAEAGGGPGKEEEAADAVNEGDSERDRTTQVYTTCSVVLRSGGRLTPIPPCYGTA